MVLFAVGVALALFGISRLFHDEQRASRRHTADRAPHVGHAANALQLPSGSGFNVVLISMDTTRADSLHCYGNESVKTPAVDRLAAEGVRFRRCVASAPITAPSHASILTGNYPFVHEVRANMTFVLPGENDTLAEMLKPAGYTTAAVVGSIIMNGEWGFAQGFDVYDDMKHARQPVNPATGRPSLERSAQEVVEVAMQWLSAHAAQRFFLFVHLYDPHLPYDPPPPFAGEYEDPYFGEIAYADSQIGRLLEELNRLQLRPRTLVVLVGDHGEGLGAHEEDAHGSFLYDTTLSVPLILSCPGRVPAGRTVDEVVRTIDILPTITAFVGATLPAKVQGVSLLSFLSGGAPHPNLLAYSETLLPRIDYGFSHLLSLQSGGWKYIHAPKPELYFLDADPHEENNLAAGKPQRMASLLDQLRVVLSSANPIGDAEKLQITPSQQAVEALRSLGYVDTTSQQEVLQFGDPLDLLNQEGANPLDFGNVIRLSTRASLRMEDHDFAGAERDLRELIAIQSEGQVDFSWAYANLGLMLAARKAWAEAIPWYRRALKISPKDGQTLTNLGVALGNTGHIDEALEMYHRALKCTPVFRETHINLAATYRYLGNEKEARKHEQIAAQMAPTQAPPRHP